jgi:hypothetical protein
MTKGRDGWKLVRVIDRTRPPTGRA